MSKSANSKLTGLHILIIAGISLFGLGIVLALAFDLVPRIGANRQIEVTNTNLEISGFPGLSVPLNEITNITLLPQSMREIGPGNRIRGNALSNNWSGQWTAGTLFTNPDGNPTLKIERVTGSNIFISFEDGNKTTEIYENLIAATER